MKKIILIILTLTLMTVPVSAASKLSNPSISCKSTGYNSIQVSWKTVKGASSYQIYRSTSTKSKSFKRVATVKTTSYNNTGLSFNKKYYYKVKAIGSSKYKNSDYSSIKYATTKLSAPSIIVESTTDGPEISWSNVSGATMYAIYRKVGTKYTRIADTSETSYSVGEKIKEKNYSYAVKAFRRVKATKTVKGKKTTYYQYYYSDYSSTKIGYRVLAVETPKGTFYKAGNKILVSILDNEKVSGYEISTLDHNKRIGCYSGKGFLCDYTGDKLAIRAYMNINGETRYSDYAEFSCNKNITFTPYSNRFSLSWTGTGTATVNVNGTLSNVSYNSFSGNTSLLKNKEVNTIEVIRNGQIVFKESFIFLDSNDTENNAEPPLLSAVTNLKAETESYSNIKLTWSDTQENVTYYILRDGKEIGLTKLKSYTDTASGSHNYSIKSVRGNESKVSPEVNVAAQSMPAPVISVSKNATSAKVSWTAVNGATRYSVSCGSFFKETSGTSMEITGLQKGTSYIVKVTATDGTVSSTAEKTFTTSAISKPYDIVASVTYDSEYNSSVVTFNNEKNILSYDRGNIKILWKGDAGSYKITCTGTTKTDGTQIKYEGTTTGNSYKFSKVANHCEYTITVIPDGNTKAAATETVYVDDTLTPEKGFPIVTNYTMKYGNAEFYIGQEWSTSLLSQLTSGTSGYERIHMDKYCHGGFTAQVFVNNSTSKEEKVWLKNYRGSDSIFDVDVYAIDNKDYDHYIEIWVANNQIIEWYSAENVIGYIDGNPIKRGSDISEVPRYGCARVWQDKGIMQFIDDSVPTDGNRIYIGGFGSLSLSHLADDRGTNLDFMLPSEWQQHHPESRNGNQVGLIAGHALNVLRVKMNKKPYIILNEMREQTFTGTINAMFRGQDPTGKYDSITVKETRSYENQRYGSQVWAETMEVSGILGDLGTLNHSKITQGPMGQISGDAMDQMMAAGNSAINKYAYDGCISKTGAGINALLCYTTRPHCAFLLGITKDSSGNLCDSNAVAISFGQYRQKNCMFAYRLAN